MAAAKALGAELDEPRAARLLAYLDAMLTLNEQINLTAVRDREQAVVLHALDGLAFARTGLHPRHALDLGTGNGFPGVAVGPGRRIDAPLTSIIGLRDGKPWLALGTPSYPPPYITLTLLNLLAYGMTLQEAAEAPRFRFDPDAKGPRPTWALGRLAIETRVPQETIDGLDRLGIAVTPLGDYNWHVGSVQAVQRDATTGDLIGVADSRRGGHAAGY